MIPPERTREIITAFEDGAIAHTGEDVPSTDLAALVETVPALRPVVAELTRGDESPAACERWGPEAYWKAVRSLDEIGRYSCRTYLLDAKVAGMVGGTGVEVAPELARAAVARARVILAGGRSTPGCMRYPDGGGLTAAGRARQEKVRLHAAAISSTNRRHPGPQQRARANT